MTPEQQRTAIAKACDWEYDDATSMMVAVVDGDIVGYPWPSLDAMHEAEKVLDWEQTNDYHHRLVDSTNGPQNAVTSSELWSWHATESQRREAFLKTLGLWKP
jgi:hypothetical protein